MARLLKANERYFYPWQLNINTSPYSSVDFLNDAGLPLGITTNNNQHFWLFSMYQVLINP